MRRPSVATNSDLVQLVLFTTFWFIENVKLGWISVETLRHCSFDERKFSRTHPSTFRPHLGKIQRGILNCDNNPAVVKRSPSINANMNIYSSNPLITGQFWQTRSSAGRDPLFQSHVARSLIRKYSFGIRHICEPTATLSKHVNTHCFVPPSSLQPRGYLH